jgi:hypothetical protein
MRKIAYFVLAAMLLFSGQIYADPNNIIRINAPIGKGAASVKWIPADSLYSTWADTADAPTCTTWTPDPAEIANGIAFLQSSSDCQQSQERTVQAREKNAITGVYRNVGSPLMEQQFTTTSLTRSAVGTYVNPGVWLAASPVISSWTNVGVPTACSNWTPDPATISGGLTFEQTATDCQQTQESTVQAREQNTISLAYRNVGALQTQNQTLTVSSVRTATGTSAAKTVTWLLKPGTNATQVGYNSQGGLGSVISYEPGYNLKFNFFGSGGWIWVSVTGYNNQRNIPSMKVELLDSSNNVIRTLSGTTTGLQLYVMGIKYTADDLAVAKVADKMRLTLQLLP